MTERWFDDAAGPVVRPYAMTRGRTRSGPEESPIDLIAVVTARAAGDADGAAGTDAAAGEAGEADSPDVTAAPSATDGTDAAEAAGGPGAAGAEDFEQLIRTAEGDAFLTGRTLVPEHVDIVQLAWRAPLSVAEIAAELDVPVGVVRVLLGDLLEAELVHISRPVPPAELPDESILREVINGLRAL